MTPHARIRRIGWLATLSVCIVLYALLHIKVNAVHAEVVRAEDQIVRLEERNILLETEVLTRSSQFKLAQWNRVDLGMSAMDAGQYIEGGRRLGEFASARADDAPAPIRLAAITTGEDAPAFPQIEHAAPAPQRDSAPMVNGRVRVAIVDVVRP